jgi:predicted PurR-regulated permease PerM
VPEQDQESGDGRFTRRALIVIGLAGLALLTWQLREVWVLLFGAILTAIIIRAIADPLTKHLHLPERVAVVLSVLLILAGVVAIVWLTGAQIAAQASGLAQILPKATRMVDERLAAFGLGNTAEAWLADLQRGDGLGISNVGGVLSSLTLITASFLIVFFGGIFLAAQPRLYSLGFLKLVPPHSRNVVAEAMVESGRALRLWLKGQLWAMILIGLMTWIGLVLLGVRSALVLALISGALEFIPYAGAITSAIPAILAALVQGPELALWVTVLYVIVHHLEAYVIQPIIQQFAVEIPAVIMLFCLLAFGLLFGFIGVLLAAPLGVVFYVMIKRLYVIETLDTPTPIPGEDKADQTSSTT